MASAPQAQLPMFYKDLTPLNSRDHSNFRARSTDRAGWVAKQHAVPLTSDEFVQAMRDFPIVFSSGDSPVPLALLALNEGVNTFFEEDGAAKGPFYVPAYVRRYPYLLARMNADSQDMTLCFDPSSGLIGEGDEGEALFDGDQPTEHTKGVLQFCQSFEEAGQRTQAFIEELKKHDLLMEGEVAIQRNEEPDTPYVYRGFLMVNQEKLQDMKGDVLRTWNKNGMLPLIYAHLFSLDNMRNVFARQVEQGWKPSAPVGNANTEAVEASA
ncbi:SapC family protein [Tsuneonella sp. HG222]